MKQIYRNYFQKSKVFLYPLLEIPKGVKFVPFNTYTTFLNSIDNFHEFTYKYFCLYHIPCEVDEQANFKNWQVFEGLYLKEHNLFEEKFHIDSRLRLYMYDFSVFKKDLQSFRDGKYSQFSEYSKKRILDFFGKKGNIAKYVESYLYPEHYYEIYSELLNVPIELLEETGELCDKPDIKLENFEKKSLQLELFK
tara:strand:- start:673 stop:1254 length:582 start_codon:yes stop_codon:yes gene_type:complete